MTRRLSSADLLPALSLLLAGTTAVCAVGWVGAASGDPIGSDLGPGEISAPAGYDLACAAGYEANDAMTGCVPLSTDPADPAPEDVTTGGADPAVIPSGLTVWHGFTVGEVIVCPDGYTVSVDDGDTTGQTWAACM